MSVKSRRWGLWERERRVNAGFSCCDTHRYIFSPALHAAGTCKSKAERYQRKDAEEKEDVPAATGPVRLAEGPGCISFSLWERRNPVPWGCSFPGCQNPRAAVSAVTHTGARRGAEQSPCWGGLNPTGCHGGVEAPATLPNCSPNPTETTAENRPSRTEMGIFLQIRSPGPLLPLGWNPWDALGSPQRIYFFLKLQKCPPGLLKSKISESPRSAERAGETARSLGARRPSSSSEENQRS